MIVKLLFLLVLISSAAAEEVLRGELRLLRDGGGALGGASGDYNHRAAKIQNALLGAHDVIAKAAEGKVQVKRATAVSSMLTNAAIDAGVSDNAMTALDNMGGGRKLSHMPSDDTEAGAAFATRAAIEKAASTGRGASHATRVGADMTHVETNHISDFAIDHVPDMGGERKLLESPDREDAIASMQNTAEAIMSLGSRATRFGSLNAAAAGGRNGMHFVDQMSDTIVHQAQTAKPGMMPRKMLSA